MGLLSENIEFFSKKVDTKCYKDYEKHNNRMVLSRIRIISYATVFMGIIFFWFDYITAKSGADTRYIRTIIILHTICVAGSLLFLTLYKKIIDWSHKKNSRLLSMVPASYVFLYVLMGVLSSLNSQRYTGNIYSYICLSSVAAVIFTLRPWVMIITFGLNHLIFLAGLNLLIKDFDMMSVKLLNSTTIIGIVIVFSLYFYKLKLKDFIIKRKLTESEENFRKLFYVNPFPVFITRNRDGKIIKASEQALKLMKIKEEDLDKPDTGLQIKENGRTELLEEFKEKHSIYNRIAEYEINGKSIWVTANYELINYGGEECTLIGLMDITEIRKVEEELSQYAFTDVLTGVLNRRMGMKKAEELMENAGADNKEFVLCFLDMDNLKSVNDTYGHGQGDNYIKAFCSTVGAELREEDIFFRMGGDEFIIIFNHMTVLEVEEIWNRIMDRFYEISKDMNIPVSRAASHGLFPYKAGMDITVEEMIEKADKYMYKEKQMHKKTMI